ncbi:MAG: hypothetical protein F4Y74_07880 [Gemmatimonadales bacterium]|nr:hypothetical protein [Gemmatimonadales bacterium]MYG20032.1 hypothetical protein [Gemmatimonadales bacterium]
MIWILADTRPDAERIRRAAGAAAHVVDGEGELTAGDNGASCIIVGCGLRSLRARTELLADLGLRRPWVPVILAVTDHAQPSLVRFVAGAEASRHPNRVSETISEFFGEVAE